MSPLSPRLVAAAGSVPVLLGAVAFAVASGGPEVVTYDGSYELLDPLDGAYESSVLLSLDDGLFVAWSTGQALGALLVVLGLLVLAALGGWSLGRRAPAGDS